MKIVAALSGGVDSAVAAARLVDAGHDVTAVHLALARTSAHGGRPRGCCSLDDARDARRAADVLGVPFYVWDFAERFAAEVIDDFVDTYAAGQTPNPCVRCNERIKFAAVLDRALGLGFDAVATGHYARLSPGPVLRRAIDTDKDQSYVLAGLHQRQLEHAVFPLGESTKGEVRAEAAQRGLGVASKPDSYEVCFVPIADTRVWLRERIAAAPGPIVDTSGSVVGTHDGAAGFTVGQRRGLRLGPGPDGRARYVTDVSPATATVTVGQVEDLDVRTVRGERASWAGAPRSGAFRCRAQVRAHGAAVPGTADVRDGVLDLTFDEPVRGVAPGQLVALYDDDVVVGAATVASTS